MNEQTQQILDKIMKSQAEISRHTGIIDALKIEIADEIIKSATPTEADDAAEEAALPRQDAPKRKQGGQRTKPQPNHEKAAKKYDGYEPALSGCACGCGEQPGSGDFVIGHQRRLSSIVGAVNAGLLDFSAIPRQAYARVIATPDISQGLKTQILEVLDEESSTVETD